jgi:catalase
MRRSSGATDATLSNEQSQSSKKDALSMEEINKVLESVAQLSLNESSTMDEQDKYPYLRKLYKALNSVEERLKVSSILNDMGEVQDMELRKM